MLPVETPKLLQPFKSSDKIRAPGSPLHRTPADVISVLLRTLIIQLMSLVNDVAKTFKAPDVTGTSDARRGMRQTRYECRFRLGCVKAGLRIDYRRWASLRETPLWLVLYGTDGEGKKLSECRKYLSELETQIPKRLFYDPPRIRMPIDLPLGVERKRVVDEVCQAIRVVEGKLIAVKDT